MTSKDFLAENESLSNHWPPHNPNDNQQLQLAIYRNIARGMQMSTRRGYHGKASSAAGTRLVLPNSSRGEENRPDFTD